MRVSISTLSPVCTNRGTEISKPVAILAFFRTLPEVSPLTFAEAEKLVQVELSEGERKEAAESWRSGMAPLYERRTGPRKVALEPGLAPWSHCEATLPGQESGPERNLFLRSRTDAGPLPASDEDIARACRRTFQVLYQLLTERTF